MIFRNKDIEIEKSVCLVCDELFGADTGAIPKELLENMPAPQRGNVISGTFGMFRASEFEKNVGGLKNV